MRVLAGGGHYYGNQAFVDGVLDDLHAQAPITVLLAHGARGADTLARSWAARRGVEVQSYPAKQRRDGAAAGPGWNHVMLELGKPDLAVAFHGGRDTADIVFIAKNADIDLLDALYDAEVA